MNVNLRAAIVCSLVLATPLLAQVEDAPSTQIAPRLEEAATKASEPARKLRLITETVTQNFIPKYVDGAGTLSNSTIFEDAAGLVGIGTITPANALHVRITDGVNNVPLKLETSGADSITGLSLKNDVRNWHVRVDGTDGDKFKVYDANAAAYRLTIDDAGRVGIGTTSPVSPFHLYGTATSDMFMGIGPDPSGITGPALTMGYGGFSFGRGAAFFNVRPDASAVAPNPSLRFLTANVERMIITNTGNVGIGTSSPSSKLTLLSTAANGTGFTVTQSSAVSATPQNDTGFYGTVVQSVPTGISNGGGIIGGRGEAWKTGPGSVTWATGGYFQTGHAAGAGTVVNAYGVQAQVLALTGTVTNGHGVYVGDVGAANDYAFYQVAADDTNYFAGNVIIGGPPSAATSTFALSVQGNANFNGTVTGTNIKAHYQDVAEWVPATSDLAPGTVVILNRGRNNEVMASATSYDTTVAGVVSAQPGISLGIEGEGKEQIATTGRVKVRVDARVKPILVGDLLVTSDVPGTAMRSEPMNINGRPFHQPGTIIGKALEPLEGGIGEILVLLSMQ